MTQSKIEWTEQVWNPIVGCTVHSAGCTNCYAMRMANRLQGMAEMGQAGLGHYLGTTRKVNGHPIWTGKLGFSEAALLAPLRRKKPTRWFVNSMSDLFHADVPWAMIDRVFAVMALCPQHTFQVLTKRSARMREFLTARDSGGTSAIIAANALDNANWLPRALAVKAEPQFQNLWPLPNVWLGVSVEDQRAADERVPDLLATPAAVRWLSCEPLLGPVDLNSLGIRSECDHEDADVEWDTNALNCRECEEEPLLDWIVAGGESGPGARPMHPDWARSLRDQCAAAGVPFFFKQWGEWAPPEAFGVTSHGPVTTAKGDVRNWLRQYVICGDNRADRLNAFSFTRHATNLVFQVGKKRAGRLLDGITHDGMPS